MDRIAEVAWKTVEEMYLDAATNRQRGEYAEMAEDGRRAVLEAFLLSLPSSEAQRPWRDMLLKVIRAKGE